MASTFLRAFAIMLALTGFSATTYTGTASSSAPGTPKADSVTPMCTSSPTNCGLD